MKVNNAVKAFFVVTLFFAFASFARADALTLTSGNNATTTPSVATSITGFQIVGNAASTTPVKIHVTNGTVHVTTVSGVTTSGNDTDTMNLSGTVANLNTALSSLTYTRGSTGTDTLEVALVNSNQIYFSDNSHVYQYVSSSLDWNNAKTAAEALTAYGATGYLVTITSLAENNFVKARLSGDAWIGASDSAVEGAWKWVTGPENGTQFWSGIDSDSGGHTVGGNYAGWSGGEPNDSGGNEDCGEEYISSGSWNDLPCSGSNIDGYVAEFGSDSNPVTVVSKNVSIVTADVPAVTSFTPPTGTTTASISANLVIVFSKTVTRDTGNILIKKTSDDSIVETIPVSGSLVTGSGSGTITINPNTTLDEGVQYYITIPNTAFKDGSNNYYDGISATSTWSFTTADGTAPVISSVTATSTASTSAAITWTTGEAGSSKVVYSAGTSFASTTTETDTGPRVTSHSKSLSNLLGCTSYNYKVVSADAAGNYATSTSALFTTVGCSGGALPSSATSTVVTVSGAATSTVTDTGRTLTVATPANFTATSSSIVIQIRGLSANTVLNTIGTPSSNVSSAASLVFDVSALINNTTILDSFDTPVTVSYTYTDADVAGLNENSLAMYHYHNGAWLQLNSCSLDTAANVITCNAPSFSTFAIFGSPQSASASVATPIKPVVIAQNVTPVATSTISIPVVAAPSVRDLKMGMTGNDVQALQQLLNKNGYPLAASGAGAPGQESVLFVNRTRAALIKFQAAHGIVPAIGYFGPLTRTKMKALGLSGTWW